MIELKKKGLINFEIPTLFDDVISQTQNADISGVENWCSDNFLSFLLKSEISQLYNMLSQYENISTDQLGDFSIVRTEVSITEYGSQFLANCIK